MPSGSHLAELNRSREIDLIGKEFGKLTVLEKDGKKNNRYTFSCKCHCGQIRSKIPGDSLRRGKTKSCGCDFPIGTLGQNLSEEEYYVHTRRRFMMKIKYSNDCWEWQGGLNNKGYAWGAWGQKPKKKKTLLHRVAYLIWNGNIPEGLLVLHKCDNPKCINPSHLFLGTQKDNIRDMYQKGRRK